LHLDARGRRMLPFVTVGPYGFLAVLTLYTVIAKYRTGGSLVIDLVLCVLTG
jgi:hypothetical protein